MYIGSVDQTETSDYVLKGNVIEYDTFNYVPGLCKIINEVIDNCVDVAIKTQFQSANQISVKITSDYVEVKDNGTGIPVVKNNDGDYIPMICWNRSKTGSNFDDNDNQAQIGMNGVGSFATNCFSSKFIGRTCDGINEYTITFKDNAESYKESVKPSTVMGTTVKFYPDLNRFSLTSIDDIHMSIIRQRLINLSLSYPDIKFKFNNKLVNVGSFKKYISMFSPSHEIYESDDYRFAILPNSSEDFRQFSYVNGLKIPDGGTHIDIITKSIVNGLRDKLVRKYKSIKPGDIKNKLMVVMFMKNFKNAKFNSQTKEKIANSAKEVNAFLGNVPFDSIVDKLFKNKDIIDPITEIYRIREEFKRRQELSSLGSVKKRIKSDKYYPSTDTKKYLILVEGECLSEDTPITMSDLTTKPLKDVDIGDSILSGDLTTQVVKAKTKLLKETLTFTSSVGEFVCGYKHKMFVLDTKNNKFVYLTAETIKNDLKRYKLVKSRIDSNTNGLLVTSNDNGVIELGTENITYTQDDYFVVMRSDVISKVHGSDVSPNDVIILG